MAESGLIDIEEVATQIVDAAIQVHRALGPGLFESAYQLCLAHELRKRGLRVDCEVVFSVIYDGVRIEHGYRIDMLVEDLIVVENKSVDEVLDIHQAQLLTYLRLGGYRLGFLINWKVKRLVDGIRRKINPAVPPNRSPVAKNYLVNS